MGVTFGSSTLGTSRGLRFLLGGWRDVVEDVRRLSADLRRSPDVCACGYTASGLGGTCLCCQTGVSQTTCSDCGGQLDALSQQLDTLFDDTLRFSPVIMDLLEGRGAIREAAQLQSIRAQVGALDGAFRRLASASAEFRRGCPASLIKDLVPLAEDLLCEIWALEKALEPGTRQWPELQAIERDRKGTDEHAGRVA